MQELEWDRVREDVEGEGEAVGPAVPEVNASAPPAEAQQHTRPAFHAISPSVLSAGQIWQGSRG